MSAAVRGHSVMTKSRSSDTLDQGEAIQMTLAGLAARNVLRNKGRTLLTILALATAIFTFVLIRTVLSSWTKGAEVSRQNMIVTRHKVSFVFWLPYRYVETVKQVPGVETATLGVWFGGRSPKDEHFFFATFAVDHRDYFDVETDVMLTPEEKKAFSENRNAIVVGDVLAAHFGWKVGDEITLESGKFPPPPGETWKFKIVGFYQPRSRNFDRNSVFLRYDLINDTRPPEEKDRIGWLVVKLKPGEKSADVARRIDERLGANEVPTLSLDERTFRTQFLAGISALLGGLAVVSLVIIVIMLLILGNTIAMGVRERTTEYGVLRALGFLPRHVAIFILGEAMLTSLLGGVVGVGGAFALIKFALGAAIEKNLGGIFPYFRTDALTVVLSLLISAGIGVIAAALPAIRASRISVVEALRHVA
jgi:putative ABC transport system permease protein